MLVIPEDGFIFFERAEEQFARAAYPDARELVLTADSETHVRFAAHDAALWPEAVVLALAGGIPAWKGAGQPLEMGMPVASSAEDDIWYKPYTDINAKPEAMKGYFDWEFGLVERIKKDGDAHFRLIR